MSHGMGECLPGHLMGKIRRFSKLAAGYGASAAQGAGIGIFNATSELIPTLSGWRFCRMMKPF